MVSVFELPTTKVMESKAWEQIRETMGEEGANAIQHLPITKRDFKWIQSLYEAAGLLFEIPIEEQIKRVSPYHLLEKLHKF